MVRAVTFVTIALSTFLAGMLRVFLRKRGWWPDWEEVGQRKREEKSLLRAYKKWRKDAGPEAAAELRVTLDRFTDAPQNVRPVEDCVR